jgi:hypothetical protein
MMSLGDDERRKNCQMPAMAGSRSTKITRRGSQIDRIALKWFDHVLALRWAEAAGEIVLAAEEEKGRSHQRAVRLRCTASRARSAGACHMLGGCD